MYIYIGLKYKLVRGETGSDRSAFTMICSCDSYALDTSKHAHERLM